MCARYTLVTDLSEVQSIVTGLIVKDPALLGPRYNIAPTQRVPIVVGADGPALVGAHFGLIPVWAADPAIAHRLINARAETAAERPAYRDAWRHRRCLVPATGYYEWRILPGYQRKVPVLVRLKSGGLITFAGLWERWRDGAGDWLTSFSVLTTPASAVIEPLHDRMPAIIDPCQRREWLAPGPPSVALDPHAGEALALHHVSPRVNDPRVDDPTCIKEWHPPPPPPSLFD